MRKQLIIDKEIFREDFHCDINVCKGACCTIKGTLGAPVSIDEIKLIQDLLPSIIQYIEKDKAIAIQGSNFYEFYEGSYYINTLDGNDCVFSVIENNIAFCVFQKLNNEKIIEFKKPISCELFPIRVEENGKIILRYEYLKDCDCAIKLGRLKNMKIYEFVKDAMVRKFGIEFYSEIIDIYTNRREKNV